MCPIAVRIAIFILKLSLSHKPWLPDYYTATLFAKGYTELPKGLEMSRSLIVNMKLIANIKVDNFYSMTFSVARWRT